MNSFQTIVLGIFGFFIIAGLLVIATVKTTGETGAAQVTLWGSAPEAYMSTVLKESFDSDDLVVTYKEIAPELLDQELLEAIASGRGPDAVLLPAELLIRYRDKVAVIPYANYSERTFRDTFIQGAEIFLDQGGIFALPFSVDPLLMYYNRDILDSAGVVTPPKFWDEFLTLGGKLTRRDGIGNISRSAVALGEFRNVASAKEIIAALFLQSGNPIIGRDAGGLYYSALDQSGTVPVLDFYTEFANPLKPSYSWNRSQPNSRDAFISSRLAIYFGFGSELRELRKANPNLNLDTAYFPRPRSSEIPLTYGKITGVSVLKIAANPSAALAVAFKLSSPQPLTRYRDLSGLPPIRRDLLAQRPTDAFGGILYDSAIRARSFPDPNPSASTPLFQTMIESVTSGKAKSREALGVAASKLQSLLK